jgi:hypothetical protein
MATLIDQESQTASVGQIIGRGIVAAHGVLLGAFLLFLLHAPAQVLNAVAQAVQAESLRGAAGGEIDPTQLSLAFLLFGCSLLFSVAVIFLFPLVQGGILGQVRDRLESPHESPRRFGSYGWAHYARLLGSLGLCMLLMIAIMAPVMCVGTALSLNAFALTPEERPDDAAQQFARQFVTHPVTLVVIGITSLLAAALGMVYWIANCIIVSKSCGVLASWQLSLRFCRKNLCAVLAVCSLIVAVSIVVAPVSLAGQLGFVTDLGAAAGMALLYSAAVGYTGVLFAGLTMSLYLARRPPAWQTSE